MMDVLVIRRRHNAVELHCIVSQWKCVPKHLLGFTICSCIHTYLESVGTARTEYRQIAQTDNMFSWLCCEKVRFMPNIYILPTLLDLIGEDLLLLSHSRNLCRYNLEIHRRT